MSNFARRHRRTLAGMLVGALALSVSPILGITGVASAADDLPPIADPIGDGNFCEGAPTTEPFTDVSDSDPSIDEIICLVATGLTSGTTATTYSPNGNITRRQMALFIKRLADMANELEVAELVDLPAYDGTPDFTDVGDESTEAQEAIGQLFQAEIVQGVTATEFRPGDPVSRRQMAAFIVRLQEFLESTPFEPIGNAFDDDDDESQEVEDNFNILGGEGIFQGDGVGNVFPGNPITRRQMANVLLRKAQVLFANGDIEGAFETPANQLIVVEPSGPAILPVSGTPDTPTGDSASREYTITVDEEACDELDLALISFGNITDNGDGTNSFADVDGQANRADGLGGTAARIETVNGVNPFAPNTAEDGDDYVTGVDVPANREVTATVNSQTANQAVALVAFCDADNNNQLNLDAADIPTEVYGIGGVQLIVPVEAGDLQAGTAEVFLHVDLVNLFTSGSPLDPSVDQNLFNYDANDEYDYDSSGVVLGNLSLDEFKSFLSGVDAGNISDPDLQSGRRGLGGVDIDGPGPFVPALIAGVVLGDIVDYSYRTDPAGVSTFELVQDVPQAVTNLTAAVGDPDSDGSDEVALSWDPVDNPDLDGYDVFTQQVVNGIPTGNWFGPVNDTLVTGTTFVDEIDGNPANNTDGDDPANGDTFQYVVLAVNGQVSPLGADYGPDSNIAELAIAADTTVLPLVSEETEIIDNGTGGIVDDDDVLRVEFQQDIAVAAGATFRLKDLDDAEFATITCGANALCQVGPNDNLTATLQADLTPAGGIGGDGDMSLNSVVEASTGITGAGTGVGAWHLPASGEGNETTGDAEDFLGADTLTRVFDGPGTEDDNNDLPDAIETQDLDAQDDNTLLTIDDDADSNSDIEDGDTVQVFDLLGVLVGSTTWDETVGGQIAIGAQPAGTPLVVQFIDDDYGIGANADVVSESTFIFVAGDAPFVASGADITTVDLDTIDVFFTMPDPPITLVGSPANFQVFDSDNTDLIATGEAGNENGNFTIRVDLDNPLVVGTDYVLRIAANTVQNNNNVPNVAEAQPFEFDPLPNVHAGPPAIETAVVNQGADTIEVTYDEDVNCQAGNATTAGDFLYDDQTELNDADEVPSAIGQIDADTCSLQFGSMELEDFGTLTYLSLAGVSQIVDTETPALAAVNEVHVVTDPTAPVIGLVTAAAAGTNTVLVTMNEQIQCADLTGADFQIRVNGEANSRTVTFVAADCSAPADNTFTLTFDGGATVAGDVLHVTSVPANTLHNEQGLITQTLITADDTV